MWNQEFAAAVAAWRSAGVKSDSSHADTGVETQNGKENIADRLAQQMEDEHKKIVAKIREDQEIALQKLQEVLYSHMPFLQ